MSNVWFTSDIHLGHKAIIKYDPIFSSEEERSNVIVQNIAGCVKKRDVLWILGDSVFTEERLVLLDQIKCTKFLVIGNHCAAHFDSWKLYDKFDKVFGITKRYGCWISHAPIHPMELFGNFCLHGHSHRFEMEIKYQHREEMWTEPDPRYIRMCIEHHNHMPRDLKWLREEIEERKLCL